MALLTCKNLSVYYGGQAAVEDVSFSVGPGEYLCIVGENGTGKSSLLRALVGLAPLRRGEILLGDGLRPQEIGYLPQQTPAQRDFPASVMEIVLSGCLNRRGLRPFYSAKERGRARRQLERLGIAELAARPYRALSGGQQQRVLLARALCATERLLLLDEPVTGLDPLAAAQMYEQIAALHREGVAVMMVSHDVTAALQAADHVLQMDTHLQFFGTVREYRESAAGRRMMGGEADA